jgi:hypothetical protein
MESKNRVQVRYSERNRAPAASQFIYNNGKFTGSEQSGAGAPHSKTLPRTPMRIRITRSVVKCGAAAPLSSF